MCFSQKDRTALAGITIKAVERASASAAVFAIDQAPGLVTGFPERGLIMCWPLRSPDALIALPDK